MTLPCASCRDWVSGCILTDAAQRKRHGTGEPGDDTGTVLAWRTLYGVPDRPAAVSADSIHYDGAVPCPRHNPTRRR